MDTEHPNTIIPQFSYYVTDATTPYGNVTVRQARAIAYYIVEELEVYARQQGYDADLGVIGTETWGQAWNEAGEAALAALSAYEARHRARWVADMLEVWG